MRKKGFEKFKLCEEVSFPVSKSCIQIDFKVLEWEPLLLATCLQHPPLHVCMTEYYMEACTSEIILIYDN